MSNDTKPLVSDEKRNTVTEGARAMGKNAAIIKAQAAELARYRSLAQVLVDALEKELQRGHLECEDGYYSCASHPNYFGPIDDGECDCGKAERDERINTALAKAKEDFDLTPTNQ